VVFTTPAIRAIRRRYPAARLTYLVERAAAPIVEHNPHLDEVILADRPRGLARVAYDLRLARRLRAAQFDIVVDFHGGPRSAWLARATGAPTRIGYAVPGRGWLYTTRVPWSPDLMPPRHSVLSQWDLVAALDRIPAARKAAPQGPASIDESPAPERDAVEMAEDPTATQMVTERLRHAGVPDDASLVIIHVSAGNPFRRWPASSFAEVAARLAAGDPGRRIIITSGPSEANAASAVADEARRRAGSAAAQIIRCGEFDLAELRALAARARLYIGGDSGPMHVASTTRVPIVALLGPTLPERSMPWRDAAIPSRAIDAGPLPCRPCHQRHCVPGDFRCLTSIAPARVITAAQELLEN
jgi:ADP-heptose:LPS heptosyltransferase